MAKEKKNAPVCEEPELQENEAAAAEEAGSVTDERDEIIKELNAKLGEANDKLLRAAAEFDNFRKRSIKEKEAIFGDSKADIIAKLLPVVDNFERAATAQSDLENYKKGVEMTVKQLLDAFTSMGVEAFGEVGEQFDPNFHNGVMHVDREDLGDNEIAEVYMKGYKVGDRVIRPATVIVAN